jgi:MerR family transcriptional regulator/heat shock protein HspR
MQDFAGERIMSEADDQSTIDDPVVSIGVLAQKVGLSVSAVRKYENAGLIIAHRTDSGHRLFSLEDIERVRNIQHLIQDLGLNIEGIRRIQALLPCWDLVPCDAETREDCPSFNDNTRPCWTIKNLNCAPQGNECRGCIVYRLGSLCTQDIKCLLHDQNRNGHGGRVVGELVQRRNAIRVENRSRRSVSG